METESRTTESRLKDLFIFRTNIAKRGDFSRLRADLEKVPGIHACTIDLGDCDKVLRVESENVTIDKVVEEVCRHGFYCEELED